MNRRTFRAALACIPGFRWLKPKPDTGSWTYTFLDASGNIAREVFQSRQALADAHPETIPMLKAPEKMPAWDKEFSWVQLNKLNRFLATRE